MLPAAADSSRLRVARFAPAVAAADYFDALLAVVALADIVAAAVVVAVVDFAVGLAGLAPQSN